jgi:hypothetical protein
MFSGKHIMTIKILKYYLATTLGYSAARKLGMLWNADVESGKITRPMLLGEKLTVFGMSMAYSPFIFPMWLMSDLDYLDIYMSGKKPSDYGYGQEKTNKWDYIIG